MKFFYMLFLMPIILYAQNNVTLISNLDQYHSVKYNDIWGYVDGNGTEYALLGVRTGTSIVSLADPSNPFEVAFIPGTNSIWRDIKTHGTYAYVVSDNTSDGLQIIDLSQLPATATLVAQLNTWFDRAHNIFIDNGYAYVIGTEGGGGMHILNLANPTSPVQTAYYTGSQYIHDVYVWDDTVVACAEDTYDLVDVSNKSNPQLISSSFAIPNIYAHSGWMTEDKRYFIGTEEFNQVDITVWDLQDRTNWDLVVPSWETSSNATVHNLFIKGNLAHVSYYSDGYVVLDVSDPLNIDEVGNYTTPDMWGCYPYLPSGLTICSDIINGLYVFQYEGTVPVELTSFTANVDGRNVQLLWSTATETNDSGFEIQRKSGSEYRTIAFVEGAGTTTERQSYSYNDKNLVPGNYTYRLKQIDFDGKYSYSDEISVDVTAPIEFTLNQNYPNPFNPTTKISFQVPVNEFVSLKVYDTLGKEISTIVEDNFSAGSYTINFDASQLPSGIYIARLNAGNKSQSIKMTLLK